MGPGARLPTSARVVEGCASENEWANRERESYLKQCCEVVKSAEEDDYQGEGWSLIKYQSDGRDAWCVVNWSFGSCSGCDFWQAGPSHVDAIDYVAALLRSAKHRAWSREECKESASQEQFETWHADRSSVMMEVFS